MLKLKIIIKLNDYDFNTVDSTSTKVSNPLGSLFEGKFKLNPINSIKTTSRRDYFELKCKQTLLE